MFGQFFLLFALIAVGYYSSKKGWITQMVNVEIGTLVMRLTCPVMLFVMIAQNEVDRTLLRIFLCLTVLQYMGAFVGGKVMRAYCKRRGWQKSFLEMLEFTTATGNTGFIGLPMALLFFRERGVLYMSAMVLGIHLYMWTYGISIIGKENERGTSWKDTTVHLLNPNCVMVIVGLVFSVKGWTSLIPIFLMQFLKTLGDISTPLSLIYIGALAGNVGIATLIRKWEAIEVALVKMILLPTLTFLAVFFLKADTLARSVCVVAMAMPCAAMMPMVTEQYSRGSEAQIRELVETSSNITLLSTFFPWGHYLCLCGFAKPCSD